MQLRRQSRIARSIRHHRSMLAAFLVPLSGCGTVEGAELQVDDVGVNREALDGDVVVNGEDHNDITWAEDSPFYRTNCENLKTDVDSGISTDCPGDKFVVGIAMGFGHSPDYNLPHTIRCCELMSNKYGTIRKSNGDRTMRETDVDNDEVVYCGISTTTMGVVSGQMISGLTGGWGHSPRYNLPHQFTCDGLGFLDSGWWVSAVRPYEMKPIVDSERVIECPSRSGGVIGLSGGNGHNSSYNVPHTIVCSTRLMLYRD